MTDRLTEGRLHSASLQVQSALEYVSRIANNQRTGYSDEKKSSFAHRKYTLADARQDARTALVGLRKAWEILDPVTETKREIAFQSGLDSFKSAIKKAKP